MRDEFVYYKNRLLFLLILFTFVIGVVWLSVEQSIELSTAQKGIINWVSYIGLYFVAQFGVAVFVGKMIGGRNTPENM